MYKIGLTGGICTGKTLILSIFKELGCYTIRADEIAKKIIFSPDSPVKDKILEVCGPEIFDKKKGIDKDEFARILFEDEEKRILINSIVHPLVKQERKSIVAEFEQTSAYDFFIYESALLVEAGVYKEFDKIVVVYTTPDEQIQRLMERDSIDREGAEAKIKSQFPLSEKLKVANYTIDTTGSFENTRNKTLETFHLMKKDLIPNNK